MLESQTGINFHIASHSTTLYHPINLIPPASEHYIMYCAFIGWWVSVYTTVSRQWCKCPFAASLIWDPEMELV